MARWWKPLPFFSATDLLINSPACVTRRTVFFQSLLVLRVNGYYGWTNKEKVWKRSSTDDETWKVRSKNTSAITHYRHAVKDNKVKIFEFITLKEMRYKNQNKESLRRSVCRSVNNINYTHLLYLSTILRYLYFTFHFMLLYTSASSHFTDILHFLLHHIHLILIASIYFAN